MGGYDLSLWIHVRTTCIRILCVCVSVVVVVISYTFVLWPYNDCMSPVEKASQQPYPARGVIFIKLELDYGLVIHIANTHWRNISQSPETARFISTTVRSLWNLTTVATALLPRPLWHFQTSTLWLRDFIRYHDTTSYQILKRALESFWYTGTCT